MKKLLEKLSLQVKSFQEGFEILSRAKSLNELAKNFVHILRGNLLTTDVNILFSPPGQEKWQSLHLGKHGEDVCIALLPDTTEQYIDYNKNESINIVIVSPMVNRAKFGILIGPKFDRSDYSDVDKITLQIFLQLLDNAYQSYITQQKEKELNFSLNLKVLQLNSLIETGIEIARLDPGLSILNLALERVSSLTNAGEGIFRIVSDKKEIEAVYFPIEFDPKKNKDSKSKIETSFDFQNNKYELILFNKESRSGVIEFDALDKSLLDAFARQVHASLENHYLHQETLEKQKIDQDISIAGEIQQKIIPEVLPEIPDYDLAGINIPTKGVGGDYYDCIPMNDGRFALVIADVSGKGIPAALLVSSLQALLTGYLESDINLPELNQKLNKAIYKASTEDKYITFYIGILDPASGKFESFNAGHNPIYLLRKSGEIVELAEGGIPVGMMGMDVPGEKEVVTIESGDKLLLYTDGVTEAMNENEEEYEDFRPLKDFFKNDQSGSASEFINSLVDDVRDFTGNTPQSDDITALYIMRK